MAPPCAGGSSGVCSYLQGYENQRPTFSFDNYQRNKFLLSSSQDVKNSDNNGLEASVEAPSSSSVQGVRAKTTGTTICGVVCKDAVVLAADTRATGGETIVEKQADKLHKMADNIYCAGAGTSADLTHTTNMIARQLELMKMTLHRESRVANAVQLMSNHLFKHMGYIGCALVMGGVDVRGPAIYMIYPHGSTDILPFATMGSGSLAAMSVFETRYKDDMTTEEGKQLCIDAITAGITNDLGSGGQVDCVVLSKGKVEHTRKALEPYPRTRLPKPVTFQQGTTPVLLESITELRSKVEIYDEPILQAHGGDTTMTDA